MQGLFPANVGKNECHNSQVMSAFIKNVRLRRTDDAVYWFTHFCAAFPEPGQQFRLSRRILILAGEDCIDLPVQWAIGDWFRSAINCKDPVVWYRSAVAQIHLICATKNWWNTVAGADYVLRWNDAEFTKKNNCATKFVKDSAPSVFLEHVQVIGTYSEWEQRMEYAQRIAERARKAKKLDARLTAAIHNRFAKSLAKDDNYLGQALYRLHVGKLGESRWPVVDPASVKASVHNAMERLKVPTLEKTPKWVQDGIHCYGSDRRFAGTVENMMGVCCAFAKYGRVHPEDPHPPEFFDVVKAWKLIADSVNAEVP